MTFRRLVAGLLLAVPTAALAQTEAATKPFTVSGTIGLVTDYRLRGVSQSDSNPALQGGVTVTHTSGFYGGFWGSNLAGWGTFGGPNLELDLIGGYKRTFGGATVDVGLTWYMYPGGADKTDYAEPYVKLSGMAGPVSLLAGVAYAPKQQALGRWYFTGADAAAGVYNDPGDKEDNLYLWGDFGLGIPTTPISARAHIGYSDGNRGLGPNATSVAPTGKYWDWLLGLDYKIGPVVLGVAYTDTDITKREAAYLQPSFSKGQDGVGSIAKSRFVFSISASF